jgi:hypothetical protein
MTIIRNEPGLNLVFIDRDGTLYCYLKKTGNLQQFNPDGWKCLITPDYPFGKLWRNIETFDSFHAALRYIERTN